mmetsp:Transcript_125288/g.359882  ORF Transcript_125288/g.359882 Transcript_125288/m.359882 type:complete len:325 (+) Transcript_125288:1067-2041(+)
MASSTRSCARRTTSMSQGAAMPAHGGALFDVLLIDGWLAAAAAPASNASSTPNAGAPVKAAASCPKTERENPVNGERAEATAAGAEPPSASSISGSGAGGAWARCSRCSAWRTTKPSARGQRSAPDPRSRTSAAPAPRSASAAPLESAALKALQKDSTTCLICAVSVRSTAPRTSGSLKAASMTASAPLKSSVGVWRRPRRVAAARRRSQATSMAPAIRSQRTAVRISAVSCGSERWFGPPAPRHASTSSCCTSSAVRRSRAGSSDDRANSKSWRSCAAAVPVSSCDALSRCKKSSSRMLSYTKPSNSWGSPMDGWAPFRFFFG